MDKNFKMKLVIAMDLMGYEQDGKGLTFIKMDDMKRVKFGSWKKVYTFVVEHNQFF